MANTKKSVIGKKPAALIVLAVLLALTVFVCVFGVNGCHKEGALYYYQNWIPACTDEMPEGLTLDRALGGENVLYYQAANITGDVAAAAEEKLDEAGVADFAAEMDGDVLKVHLPADADAFAAELALYNYQNGPTLSASSVSLNSEYFVSASLKAGSSYSASADTLSIRLNDEALKLFEANGVTSKSMLTFAVDEMGLSLTLFNTESTYGSYTPYELKGDTLSFPVNSEGSAYFNAVVSYINSEKMPASLTETTPAELAVVAASAASAEADPAAEAAPAAEESEKPSAVVPVIILWAAFLAAAVVLAVRFKKNGIAGIWAALLFIVYIFFMLADVLGKSGFLGYVTYILCVVCMLYVAFSSAMLLNAIAAARVAGQADRAAIGAGYRSSRKLFYLIAAAVMVVGFVLAFIPAVALAGFILMLTVLGNIVLNRLFVPGVLYLFNTVTR